MNKLKLNIDDLAVESFSTHAAELSRGTVLAHHSGDSCNTFDQFTCAGYVTCHGTGSCNGMESCDRQCIPQQTQWWIDQGPGDATPCCTRNC